MTTDDGGDDRINSALIAAALLAMLIGRVVWGAGWLPGPVVLGAVTTVFVAIVWVLGVRIARHEGVKLREVFRRGLPGRRA